MDHNKDEAVSVDVLVTFYNQEQYVDKALSSIMNQRTDFPFRILIGDDGSSDGTREKIKAWQERYPEIIRLYVMDRDESDEPGGFRFARNRLNLLEHVDAKYIAFLDGDDYYDDPEKLQKQVEILEDPDNADCILCAHDLDRLYPDGRRECINGTRMKEGKLTQYQYWPKYYCSTESEMIRSSFIPQIPRDILTNMFDDTMITLAALQHGKMYYLPESMGVYVQTGEGLYTGEKVVFRYLLNMMCYDLSCQINPSIKRYSNRKYAGTWRVLMKMRDEIDAEKYRHLSKESELHGLTNAWNWIHFHTITDSEKRRLLNKARWFSIRPAVWDILLNVRSSFRKMIAQNK